MFVLKCLRSYIYSSFIIIVFVLPFVLPLGFFVIPFPNNWPSPSPPPILLSFLSLFILSHAEYPFKFLSFIPLSPLSPPSLSVSILFYFSLCIFFLSNPMLPLPPPEMFLSPNLSLPIHFLIIHPFCISFPIFSSLISPPPIHMFPLPSLLANLKSVSYAPYCVCSGGSASGELLKILMPSLTKWRPYRGYEVRGGGGFVDVLVGL